MGGGRSQGGGASFAAGLLFAAATLGLSAFGIARSRDIDLKITPTTDVNCPWRARGGCVRAIAGVRLGAFSLSSEVGYLSAPARRRWFADQQRLHVALATAGPIPVEVGGRTLTVAARRRPIVDVLRQGAPALLTALIMLVVGAFVGRRRPTDPAARALFGLCIGAFGAIVPTVANATRGVALDPETSWAMWALNLIALVVCGANLLRLAAVFPSQRAGRIGALVATPLPAIVGAVLIGLDLTNVAINGPLLFLLVALVVATAAMIQSYRRAKTQVQALQTRWMAWGYAIPLLIVGLTRIPVLFSEAAAQDTNELLVTPSIVAFPIAIGIAILRARLFDIEVVIRRTVVGAAITAVALFGYHLALAALSTRPDTAAGFTSTFLAAMVLSFVLQPVQAGLESRLDRAYFRNRHDYHHALARLPDALAGCADAAEAAAHTLGAIRAAMEADVALVALDPAFGPEAWSEGVASDVRGAAPWAALRALPGTRISDTEDDDPVSRWMAALGAEAVFPLRTADAFIGVLACARPRGVRIFSADDLELLRATASALALAMSRAAAFDTIRRMNATLEETVRRRTEELDAVRMRLYQREKMSSLALLAAGVAHELNTPLGVVSSASQQLVDELTRDGAAERTLRLARLGHEAARRASETVDALLAFSRPGARDPEWTDLRAVIEGALRIAGPTLRRRRVEARVAMDAMPEALCHPALIGQVALNLVLNAAAAIGEGGEVRVTGAMTPEGAARVAVEDTGPGIDPELRARIFEPFFTTKGPGEGTGLGLALCFAIMDLHGGRIWEEGEVGRGARFVFELPPRARG